MSEDQLTLLALDLRSVPDPLRSGAIFEHVQRSPPTFPIVPLRCRSLPLSLRSLPFNSRLFTICPDFQIGFDREWIVAQWNGAIIRSYVTACRTKRSLPSGKISGSCAISVDAEKYGTYVLCGVKFSGDSHFMLFGATSVHSPPSWKNPTLFCVAPPS